MAPQSSSPTLDDRWKPSLTEDDRAILQDFLVEAVEMLDEADRHVLALDAAVDRAAVDAVFRAYHSIKGVAGMIGLPPIQALAHRLETLLDVVRGGRTVPGIVDATLATSDLLRRMISWIEPAARGEPVVGDCPPFTAPLAALEARSRALVGGAPRSVAPSASRRPEALRRSIAAPRPSALAHLPPPPLPSRCPPQPSPTEHVPAPAAARPQATVRVDAQKLDSIVDMIGELIIAESLVAADPSVAGGGPALAAKLAMLGRVSKELQRTAMRLRMVPVRGTFEKMARVVRETARAVDKQAELVVEGGDTELDRTMVETLHDPLVHMVRNAVDHGLESPAQREAAGKPPVGRVTLRAMHAGGEIVVEIADDGRGLDPAHILAKAREKGVVRPGDAVAPGAVLALLFAPGFSTAERVTNISGRGVGMDVVRSEVEKVRGRVEIESRLGCGTTFRIRLPLTLAIIDGLVARLGDERFVVSSAWVREAVRPAAGDVLSVRGSTEMLRVRGVPLRLVRLADLLGSRAPRRPLHEALVLVVEVGGARLGVVVDELIGKQEVVIKSLGGTFLGARGIAGGAILGDGRIALIVDMPRLVESVVKEPDARDVGAPPASAA